MGGTEPTYYVAVLPYVAAYAALPPTDPWDRDVEAAFYAGLAQFDIAGLELPFFGSLHRHDDAWLLDRLDPNWTYVLTLMPGVMDRLTADPRFGLASTDKDGRARAVDFAESARRTVEHLRRHIGRPAVRAVEIHSAPRRSDAGSESSVEALTSSLDELRAWDWGGSSLVLEHCDAFVPGQTPIKGFLGLGDEIAAIRESNGRTPVSLGVNWGRSALETRSADGALAHIRRARKTATLGALFFSGVCADDPDYGKWQDAHPPFSTKCPSSLLTPEAAAAALAEARDCPIVGLKLQVLPRSLGADARLAVIRDGLERLTPRPSCG